MKREPVPKSKHIRSAGYAPATRTVEIEYESGAVYQKDDVAPEQYEAFRTADSPGSYAAANFKGMRKVPALTGGDPCPGCGHLLSLHYFDVTSVPRCLHELATAMGPQRCSCTNYRMPEPAVLPALPSQQTGTSVDLEGVIEASHEETMIVLKVGTDAQNNLWTPEALRGLAEQASDCLIFHEESGELHARVRVIDKFNLTGVSLIPGPAERP